MIFFLIFNLFIYLFLMMEVFIYKQPINHFMLFDLS